jgi:cytoskeletal protein RodZ
MNEEWLRNLSDALKDHESPAPEGLWEEIDAKLFPKKRRQVLPLIFRWAATAVLVGGITMYVNTFLVSPAVESAFMRDAQLPQSKVATKLPPRQAAESTEAPLPDSPQSHPAVSISPRPAVESPHSKFVAKISPRPLAEFTEAESAHSKYVAKLSPRPAAEFTEAQFTEAESTETDAKPRPLLSLFSAQSGSDFTQSVGGFARLSGTPLSFTTLNPDMDQVIEGNKEQEVRTDIHHDIPVTFGLQLSLPVAERWKLSTGISYTRMGSHSYSGTAGYAVSTRQEVHFVGIPLQMQYRFFAGQRIQLYASTGLLLEKAVAARVRSNYIVDHQLVSESTERISERPLRWSSHLGVGVEAKVLPGVDLYLEPHFRYSFKSASCITTVHDARPAQAGLKVGLCYNLR